MVKERERWVDCIKTFACILVVLGHFFQSMVQANILNNSDSYQWFNKTIYYFHVPLFFICSGYLYQKLTKISSVCDWGNNVLKKLINLGVPYFTFSFATWIMKKVFSGSVNSQIGGLADTLFIHPTSPYWYLYALFFIFLVTPAVKSKIQMISVFALSVIIKLFAIKGIGGGIQAVSYICANEIWFVLGMTLSFVSYPEIIEKRRSAVISIVGIIMFILLSVVVYQRGSTSALVSFILGLLACASIVSLFISMFKNDRSNSVLTFLSKFTMPIFLMHTMFAAAIRVVLIKIGITDAIVNVLIGLVISFIGPIIAALIMHKSRYLEFFLYPGVLIKIK